MSTPLPSVPAEPAKSSLQLGVPRSEKITNRHLERLAMVYVRQSTPQQLIRHQESTQVQYSLKLRAQELGWPEARVIVIDDDLGKSGGSVAGRVGFQRLVAEVTLDHVGIILGVEMSRLARSCKDWYQLLEVCAVFGTLIADLDGVYEPAHYNDRLLLGLKGTMSEAELHILKQRMTQGKLNKARRGELFFKMPLGYVRRETGEVVMDPDEQVQEVVRLIFRTFDDLGTLNAVLRFLVKNGVRLPIRAYEKSCKGDLQWHRPNRGTLCKVLSNPFYAGAYTYGQRTVDPRRKIAGRPQTGRIAVPPEQCQVFLKDRFPAYISWQHYEQNRQRLRANRSVADAIGAARRGPSLLSGLLVCGKCGSRLSVRYSGQKTRHSYACSSQSTRYGEPICQSLAGAPLDQFVSGQLLEVLQPSSLELSLEAAKHIEEQRRELDGLWQSRLERARYETQRAARQYDQVEPENRLVARQLERDWEKCLQHQKELDEDYARFVQEQPRLLSTEERDAIRGLASDIPALWDSPHTTPMDRKEILRQVIDRIEVEVVDHSECVKLTIYWAGGMQTHHHMIRPVASMEQLGYWPQLAARLKELASQNLSTREIAERLNAKGWRPPKLEKFDFNVVTSLLHRLGLCEVKPRSLAPDALGENEWRLETLAVKLGMPTPTLYAWLRRDWLKAKRSEQGRWIIQADAIEVERLRQLRTLANGYGTRRLWTDSPIPVVRN
jgi:DNA invertase Pin-like site-specific DNA recombinase